MSVKVKDLMKDLKQRDQESIVLLDQGSNTEELKFINQVNLLDYEDLEDQPEDQIDQKILLLSS